MANLPLLLFFLEENSARYKVLKASDVQTAKDILEENKVDLVIISQCLTKCNGAELLKEINSLQQDVKSLFIGNISDPKVIEILKQDIKFSEYMSAPPGLKDCIERINNILQ